ncbi:hypothetical protein TRFO_11974 [Tritrichomonas foetus]|uniref:Protein kinase domain-containing protein n=1 Tax=Tritrichomonas foetus TaxID=1144522 RepID=A0A1J4J673_9EUKA|nr:hypothetical protein TRFO_11974 [Tritrichomonas foetus]|eukprot:OHS93163.1 hypothetical protein TRFO_11974 [Tritrichomonas foetus]
MIHNELSSNSKQSFQNFMIPNAADQADITEFNKVIIDQNSSPIEIEFFPKIVIKFYFNQFNNSSLLAQIHQAKYVVLDFFSSVEPENDLFIVIAYNNSCSILRLQQELTEDERYFFELLSTKILFILSEKSMDLIQTKFPNITLHNSYTSDVKDELVIFTKFAINSISFFKQIPENINYVLLPLTLLNYFALSLKPVFLLLLKRSEYYMFDPIQSSKLSINSFIVLRHNQKNRKFLLEKTNLVKMMLTRIKRDAHFLVRKEINECPIFAKMYAIFPSTHSYDIIYEYVPGKSLKEKGIDTIDHELKLQILIRVLIAFSYLQKYGIFEVHISEDSIFFDNEGRPKIALLPSAEIKTQSEKLNNFIKFLFGKTDSDESNIPNYVQKLINILDCNSKDVDSCLPIKYITEYIIHKSKVDKTQILDLLKYAEFHYSPDQKNANALFYHAEYLKLKNELNNGIPFYEKAVELHHIKSIMKIAKLYKNGYFGQENSCKCVNYYIYAAKKGCFKAIAIIEDFLKNQTFQISNESIDSFMNSRSLFHIGQKLFQDKELTEAMKYLEKSNSLGHRDAPFIIWFITRNIEYLKQSAARGNADALFNLGNHYADNKEFDKAIDYYQKSIKFEHFQAANNLTNLYTFDLHNVEMALKIANEANKYKMCNWQEDYDYSLPVFVDYYPKGIRLSTCDLTNNLYLCLYAKNNQFDQSSFYFSKRTDNPLLALNVGICYDSGISEDIQIVYHEKSLDQIKKKESNFKLPTRATFSLVNYQEIIGFRHFNEFVKIEYYKMFQRAVYYIDSDEISIDLCPLHLCTISLYPEEKGEIKYISVCLKKYIMLFALGKNHCNKFYDFLHNLETAVVYPTHANDFQRIKEKFGITLSLNSNQVNAYNIIKKCVDNHMNMPSIEIKNLIDHAPSISFNNLSALTVKCAYYFMIVRYFYGKFPSISHGSFINNDFVTLFGSEFDNIKLAFHKPSASLYMVSTNYHTLPIINHPCLSRFYGRVDEPGYHYAVYSYGPYGALREHLAKNNEWNDDFTNILYQLLCGIDTLHEKGIVHSSINSDHVLIDYKNKAVLSYFSEFRYANDIESYQKDIYDFGLLIFEMATHTTYKCNSNLCIPTNVPSYINDLFTYCVKYKLPTIFLIKFLEHHNSTPFKKLINSVNFSYNRKDIQIYLSDPVNTCGKMFVMAFYDQFQVIQQNISDENNSFRNSLKNDEKAFHYYSIHQAEDMYIELNLGNLYADGRGVQKNINKAIECYEFAASLGNLKAFFNLGLAFSDKLSTRQKMFENLMRLDYMDIIPTSDPSLM